ncbi:MAG: hypothetical protein JJV99_06485 [Colwellia sp.]|nr:hypothetical protein [Colwellia sp.]
MSIDHTDVNYVNPAIATATVTKDGTAQEGVVVSFSTTLGVLYPESGTALTDANGQASIDVHPGSIRGAGAISATAMEVASVSPVGFKSAGDGDSTGVVGKVIVITSTNANVTAANPATLTVTVTDNDENVTGEVVTFTTTIGVLDPKSGTALTNSNGQATIVLAAGTEKGAGIISVITSTGELNTLGFATEGDGSEVGGNALTITSFTNSTSISNANPAIITVHFEQADGTDLANEVITLTSTLGVLAPNTGTVLTNSTGDATITLTAGTVEGAGVLTAISGSGDVVTQGFFTAGDGAVQDKTIALTLGSLNVSASSPETLTATLLDKGVPVEGVLIEFRLDGTLAGLLISEYAYTDVNGKATVLLSSDNEAGIGMVTAHAVSSNDSGDDDYYGYAKVAFTAAGDGALQEKNISLTISSPNVSASLPATVTATVLDKGIPVVGRIVQFSSSIGYFDPSAGLVYQYVMTGTNGEASITLKADDVAGFGTVNASVSDECCYGVAQIGFISEGNGVEGGGNLLTITSFTNQTAISNANPSEITIHFEKADATPLVNEVISFTSTLGVLDPITGTVLTDALGNATITLSAGIVRGAGLLTVFSSKGNVLSQGFFTEGDSVGTGVNISLVLTDLNGNVVDQISSISSGKLTATVTGVTKAVIVTFETDIGSIPIPTAIATTGSGYIATVDLLAGNSLGAGTVTASLVSGESEQLVFSIGASSLSMGYDIDEDGYDIDDHGLIKLSSSSISAGATAGLTVQIWDVSDATNATLFETETVEVTFSSGCSGLTIPSALIDSPVATISGIAQSTYLAQGCEGADIVTATANAGGVILSATGTITVATPIAGSIEFVSATPENISLKGVGGIESSIVIFKVKDTNGNVVANKEVDFSLNTEVGGIDISPASAITDANGEVQTVINSGTIHTSVRVRAELTYDASIFSQSNLLVISTGIPDQDSFSLSASVLNPEGWNIDGTNVEVTARLADAFNNPVPDGTAVAFTTEGGAIENSCLTTNGICTVMWTSQNVRPEGQELGEMNNGPTLIKGSVDISQGVDFTSKAIMFDVTTTEGTDNVSLDSTFDDKASLLMSINSSLVNSDVMAVSGFEDILEFISINELDITITDASTGTVTTLDVLGIADGINYYNDATKIYGTIDISGGKDFTVNDIAFDVQTLDGTDRVTLDTDLSDTTDLIDAINSDLTDSSIVAKAFVDTGKSYLLLTSPTRLDMKISDAGGSSTTSVQLGLRDGTTFPTRVNSSVPKTFNVMGQKYGGRATILATAIGEESFPDLNGNGRFDAAEMSAFRGNNISGRAYDLKEAFVDHNEDGLFNPGEEGGETGGELETFVDFTDGDPNGSTDGVFNQNDDKYNGSLCSDNNTVNCNLNKQSVNVRGSLVLVMSGSNPRFVTTYPANGASINITSDGTASASVIIADLHNQPMPAGTTVAFDAAVGSIKGISSYIWPNFTKNGGSSFGVTIQGVEGKTISGSLTVTVTTPSGVVTTYRVATINITP